MSVRAMGAVWALKIPPADKLVLLAMVDHADDEGKRIHPSVELISSKTGYSDRQVRRIVDADVWHERGEERTESRDDPPSAGGS